MPSCSDPSIVSGAEALSARDPGDISGPPLGETVLTIENVARMFSVTRLTLRYYEFRGLIKRRHRVGSVPVYGWADCDRIAFIIKCRRVGLPLSAVAPIVTAVDDDTNIAAHRIGQEACAKLIKHLEQRRKILDDGLAELSHTHSLLTVKILGSDHINRRD